MTAIDRISIPRGRTGAGVALTLALLALCSPALARADGGEITGRVLDATTGNPPTAVTIDVDTPGASDGDPVPDPDAIVTVGPGGDFTVAGLAAGSYLLGVAPADGDGASWYPAAPDPGHSTPVAVSGDATTALSTVMLAQPGGTVGGEVLGPDGPLPGLPVTASITEPDGSRYTLAQTTSGVDGDYRFWGLAPGAWQVSAGGGSWSPTTATVTTVNGGWYPLELALTPAPSPTPSPAPSPTPSATPATIRLHLDRVRAHGRWVAVRARVTDPAPLAGAVTLTTGRRWRTTVTLGSVVSRHGRVTQRFVLPRPARRLVRPVIALHLDATATSARMSASVRLRYPRTARQKTSRPSRT